MYERVEILPAEVYEREGKSVIWVCERAQRPEQMNLMALLKSGKRSRFVIHSYLNDNAFTAVKRMQSTKQKV